MNRTPASACALPVPSFLAELPVLLRWRLLLGNVVAALAGALLLPQRPEAALFATIALGCGSLVAAATILNQVQERHLDARLPRTCQRPLVTGQISATTALILAAVALAGGLLLLAACAPAAAGIGLVALLIYNGLYTPLKPRTALALLPGAICGALPPLIGWCAAGGACGDPRGLLPVGLMLLWQVPHVWLHWQSAAADYRTAGIPTLAAQLSPLHLQALIRLWVGALCAGALLLPALGLLRGAGAWGYLAAIALLLPFPAWDATLARRLHLFPPLLTIALLCQQ